MSKRRKGVYNTVCHSYVCRIHASKLAVLWGHPNVSKIVTIAGFRMNSKLKKKKNWNISLAFLNDAASGLKEPAPLCSELGYRSAPSLLKISTALISCQMRNLEFYTIHVPYIVYIPATSAL